MCCVKTIISSYICLCAGELHSACPTRKCHRSAFCPGGFREALERNCNTNASVFAERSESEPRPEWPFCSSCFPAFRTPVSPSFAYFSEAGRLDSSQTSPPRFRVPASPSPTHPPSSTPLFTGSGDLTCSERLLVNPTSKLLHTNGMWVTTAFSHCWKETSVFSVLTTCTVL